VQFVEAGGAAAVITSLDRLAQAERGAAGTIISREES
jgi:carbamate kinase